MTPRVFLRDKCAVLLAAGFAIFFAATMLSVLSVAPGAIAFLCIVLLLCTLLPLGAEYVQKRRFYLELQEILTGLQEKYLICSFLESPGFAEGDLLCKSLTEVSRAMTENVAAARREMGEYRSYIETWIHEVKTPIASARLLLENNDSPFAGRLGEEIFKIDGYVEQALFYARSSTVAQDYLIKAVTLREIVSNSVKKYAHVLIAAGFQIHLEQLEVTVFSDPKWAEFILGQLLANALHYRRDCPQLTFTAREDAASVTLTIADNGIGIPAADLPRIFDKGFTGQNGRSGAARATGLGLYLCRKLCGKLSLSLTAASVPGEGSEFALVFPRSKFSTGD